MIRYVFREDEPLRIKAAAKADAQVIGEALDEIAIKAGGELTPHAVVDAARNRRHALHHHFEWDDAVAAENYRIDQARNLIRVVRVVDEKTSEGTTRAFLSVSDRDGTSYRHIEEVKKSADLQAALLRQADRDLEAIERRYASLKEICKIVSEAREAIARRVQQEENRAAA